MTRRIHVLGVPHTVANEDFTVCAFTAKVMLFPDVMRPFGWEIIEYSNGGSTSSADHHVEILSANEFRSLTKRTSRDDPHNADVDNVELLDAFHKKLIATLEQKAWAQPGDIVCHTWGPNHDAANALPECHHVESSVGYSANPGLAFRIFESSAWMHYHYGKEGKNEGHHYKWVVPSAFDTERWPPCEASGEYVLFLGRVTERKGIRTILEIARRLPDMPFHIYGPGDVSQWLSDCPPNLTFRGPVFGREKVEVIRNARCMLMPTEYLEPFGFSGVESQLCGTPLISTSFGAFQETVIDGVTGYRCHTLADFTRAIEMSDSLDRINIAASARERYSMEVVGRQYDWIFRQIQDLSGRGWYSQRSRKFFSAGNQPKEKTSRIYVFLPYFGQFLNYFQFYLDSLAKNTDSLVVFLLTDIDLAQYRIPRNLIVIPMTLATLRRRIAKFMFDEFGLETDPDDWIRETYKLVDFKPLYPRIFESILDQYDVTENDFVGWGDCDVIYGKFSDFIDNLEDYDVIGGFHGHFTAVKNRDSLKNVFKDVQNLPQLLLDEKIHLVDEIGLREPLQALVDVKRYKMFYINRYFCDIVPPQFYSRFRPDYDSWERNFFDAYNPTKNIAHISYDEHGELTVFYEDGSNRKAIYCHLQKRDMELEFTSTVRGFNIGENSFEQIV